MDFFTFIIIAVFVYNIFAKKDKPPQRRPQRPGEKQIPTQPQTTTQGRKKKESIFESLERQIRESAERLDQELQGGKTVQKRATSTGTSPQRMKPQTSAKTKKQLGTEGAGGGEGYSEYGKYASTQGTQGIEGTQGQEGLYGGEGTWGNEGGYYAQKQKAGRAVSGEIGASPIYAQPDRLAGTLGFSSSEVVQGIIWAEVLKEPKGKRALSGR